MSEILILSGLLMLVGAYTLWVSKKEERLKRRLCKNLFYLGITTGILRHIDNPSVTERLGDVQDSEWREMCRLLDWEDDV